MVVCLHLTILNVLWLNIFTHNIGNGFDGSFFDPVSVSESKNPDYTA